MIGRKWIVGLALGIALIGFGICPVHGGIIYQGHTFYEFNGHYYAMTEGLVVNWSATEAKAVALGGHLAAITSQAEQAFINDTFLSDDGTMAWIGLSDHVTEGTYVWTTGEPLDYTNWAPLEPYDVYGGVEDYVCINWHRHFITTEPRPEKGTWNDVSDQVWIPGIVELDSNPVPEPTSVVLWSGLGVAGLIAARRRRG